MIERIVDHRSAVALLVLNAVLVSHSIEPMTMVGSGTLVSLGAYFLKDKVSCYVGECCHEADSDKWIVFDPDFDQISQHIFGQHIALNVVKKSIRQHLRNKNPPKSVAISFHGFTGVGKNHLANLLAKTIYRKENNTGDSSFVSRISATHFLTDNLLDTKRKIKKFVETSLENCPRAMFIFDEVDKFPEKFLDILVPYLDHNLPPKNSKAIFIFLSNSGGELINTKVRELRYKGIARKDIRYKDFEEIISSEAFRVGGLRNSELVSRGLVDLYVPFLPLEREHIKQCIIDYLRNHRMYADPLDRPGALFVEKVANEIQFVSDTEMFSRYGCKRVSSRVDILIE